MWTNETITELMIVLAICSTVFVWISEDVVSESVSSKCPNTRDISTDKTRTNAGN